MKFWKDSLRPGKYRLRDGREKEFKLADTKHLLQRAKDMLAAGLQIPLAWEHQSTSKPMTPDEAKAQNVKLNLGFLEDVVLTADGIIEALVDVPVEADAKRIPAVRHVSPRIETDFVDGSGRKWPGESIVHLAVTPRPVQHNQGAFRPVSLSYCLSLDDWRVVDLALDKDEDEEKDSGEKKDPEKYTEEQKADNSEEDPGKATSDDKLEDEKDADAEEEDVQKSLTMDTDSLKDVVELLRKLGIVLGEDTDPDTFIPRLKAAALTKEAAENPAALDGAREEVKEMPATPVSMSMEKELTALKTQVSKLKRSEVESRIDKLHRSGRISGPIREKYLKEAKSVELSLDATGELSPSPFLAKLEAFEELPAGLWGPHEDLSRGQELGLPPEGQPEFNAEDRAQVENRVKDFLSMIPGRS